jgi:hypothetical protein
MTKQMLLMHITVYTTWIDIWPVTVLPHCMLEISIGGKTNPAASAPAQKKKTRKARHVSDHGRGVDQLLLCEAARIIKPLSVCLSS